MDKIWSGSVSDPKFPVVRDTPLTLCELRRRYKRTARGKYVYLTGKMHANTVFGSI
jgi:hypothetical protein